MIPRLFENLMEATAIVDADEELGLNKNQIILKEVIMSQNLVKINEMAKRLGVPTSWLYIRTRTNAIPFVKIGKYVRFDPDEVIQWFRGKTAGQEA